MTILSLRPAVNNEVIAKDAIKLAKKRLETAIPKQASEEEKSLTRAQFIRFEKVIEIYMQTLDLRVVVNGQ